MGFLVPVAQRLAKVCRCIVSMAKCTQSLLFLSLRTCFFISLLSTFAHSLTHSLTALFEALSHRYPDIIPFITFSAIPTQHSHPPPTHPSTSHISHTRRNGTQITPHPQAPPFRIPQTIPHRNPRRPPRYTPPISSNLALPRNRLHAAQEAPLRARVLLGRS